MDNVNIITKSRGERIRLVCEELGPTFIKLGQIASTRQDIIPLDIINELENLQDHVSPICYQQVEHVINTEFSMDLSKIFHSFEEFPMASASIGQVHRARLHSGQWVAVKIQRPNITEIIDVDLEILSDLALLSERRTDWGKFYHFTDLVNEFSNSLRNELNYLQEARNTEKAKENLQNKGFSIMIPSIHWEYTSKRVLVMDLLNGSKISETTNGEDIAKEIIEVIFHMILFDGFFHADPHPGNLILIDNQTIGLIDFGMVGRISEKLQQELINVMIGLMRRNTKTIVKAIQNIGVLPDSIDLKRFYQDVDALRDKYYEIPFSEISLSESIRDLFTISKRHGVVMPSEFLLLAKALITLEGLVETIAPNINIVQIAEPIGKKYFMKKYCPDKIITKVVDQSLEYGQVILEIPLLTRDILQKAKDGKINLQITIPKLDVFLRKLDRISNRLSFSIIMLSFSIIMVGLIIGSSIGGRRQTLLWELPAIEIGFVVAAILFLWLITAIFRSGRF
ncbi:ABC1 kinase family protein [Desulfuribacillus stibiiarsenatis]|nr:AarF/ABC1/UbiB kinase family protein [Desulfuribacillus stibiiarsenatis]